MLKKAADDRADADVVGEPWDARAQAAHAPYDKVDPDSRDACLYSARMTLASVNAFTLMMCAAPPSDLSIQPTLTVRPGFQVNVMVNKDLVLRPYQPLFVQRGPAQ